MQAVQRVNLSKKYQPLVVRDSSRWLQLFFNNRSLASMKKCSTSNSSILFPGRFCTLALSVQSIFQTPRQYFSFNFLVVRRAHKGRTIIIYLFHSDTITSKDNPKHRLNAKLMQGPFLPHPHKCANTFIFPLG